VLVQEVPCKDVDGWVDARMLSHTQPISFSAASSVLFHVSIAVFLFKLFTMTLQRCLTTLLQLLHGEFALRCGVLRRDSRHSSCMRTVSRSTEILCSLSISVLTCRRRAIIFLRLSVSGCMASRVAFISCTSDDVIVNDDTDDDTSIRYTLNRGVVFLSRTLIQRRPCVDFDRHLVYVARQRRALQPLCLRHGRNTILISRAYLLVVGRVIAVKSSGIMNGK